MLVRFDLRPNSVRQSRDSWNATVELQAKSNEPGDTIVTHPTNGASGNGTWGLAEWKVGDRFEWLCHVSRSCSGSGIRVGIALACRADERGECRPSIARLGHPLWTWIEMRESEQRAGNRAVQYGTRPARNPIMFLSDAYGGRF